MVLLNWFMSALLLLGLFSHVDAKSCLKGHKMVGGICKVCHTGSYQPEENYSNRCITCRNCNVESGSSVLKKCTNESNRECRCRQGFVPSDTDSSTCKCDRGFGKINGECLKCKDGFFNDEIDSPCKEWRKCSTGVNKTGTDTSDNICNEESKTYVTTTTALNKMTSLNKHKGAAGTETLSKHNKSTTITAPADSAPGPAVTPKGNSKSITDSPMGVTGVILLSCVIALLVLTAVICKLLIPPCPRKRKAEVRTFTQDSLCRRPVEESGDGSQSSLKQYTDEP